MTRFLDVTDSALCVVDTLISYFIVQKIHQLEMTFSVKQIISPGSLSILITMLRHNMAAISEIADFRTRSALFVICSVILGLSTHSSIGESQGRNELHVCQRWRMKANDEGANFTRKEKEHFKFCVQIRYVFPLCR